MELMRCFSPITGMIRYRARILLAALSVACAATGQGLAQAPPAEPSKFEVASVRENTNDDGKILLGIQPGGRFNAHNVPLWDLIRQAYGVQRTQLVGAPKWTENARYDIVAKAPGEISRSGPGAPIGPLNFMLQDLLQDRFKLRVHRDTREQQIYALTFARSDKSLGPGLKPSTADCESMRGGRGRGAMPAFPETGRPLCGMRMAPGQIVAGGANIAQLTQGLSVWAQRIVIDQTALTGSYDIDLTFTPDRLPQGGPPPGAPMPSIDPNGPSLFTAVQEQLGLKLESQRAPIEVLVIDHVERPTPD